MNSVKIDRIGKNRFDLSHDVKMSLNMGELVPFAAIECVPGDKFQIGCEAFLRFAPMVSPVMHRNHVFTHWFFVPNRIVWPQWEKWITNTKVGGVLPAHPTFTLTAGNDITRLADYLGMPTPIGAEAETVSAIPFAAYQKIYNDYYRDQNLIAEVNTELNDGANDYSVFRNIRRRAWMHDYFTASLPDPQKGDQVEIPLGSQNVILDPASEGVTEANWKKTADYGQVGDAGATSIAGGGTPGNLQDVNSNSLVYDPNGTLITEQSGAATSINDLRTAIKLQEWLEKNARGGTRYPELMLVHFNQRSSDQRLQRPEYITGTKSPVQISEVLSTAETTELPQGNMAGHGISLTSGGYGSYSCEEHGYIIGIMSVMPETAYQQGIPKHFLKYNEPTELLWPSFAHLGEQEVLHKEVYGYQGAPGGDTFGYMPRYGEYRYIPSRVAGDFKTTLNTWHEGRIFAEPPSLNQLFIECDPTHRIFAVTDPTVQKLYCHIYNKISAVRPLPMYGTPSF